MKSWDWFSFDWFMPDTFMSMEWQYPVFLWMLLLVPILPVARWFISSGKHQKLSLSLPSNHAEADPLAWLRFAPITVLCLSICCILIALARPQRSHEQVEQWAEGIDIMLVLDISASMRFKDFKPNRLEATKKVAKDFISGRFEDRIGIVIFSGDALSYAPLTTDYNMLGSLIDQLNFTMIPKSGTAIGSAIAVGVNRMRESEAESKVMVVLSDGENNAGSIDPITAANLCYAYGIKVYTIGMSKQGRVQTGTDFLGNPVYAENSLDEDLLTDVAHIGKGKYYRATDNKALQDVFDQINELEKSEIEETKYKDTQDFYFQYLAWGMAFFIVWVGLKSTFMSYALED